MSTRSLSVCRTILRGVKQSFAHRESQVKKVKNAAHFSFFSFFLHSPFSFLLWRFLVYLPNERTVDAKILPCTCSSITYNVGGINRRWFQMLAVCSVCVCRRWFLSRRVTCSGLLAWLEMKTATTTTITLTVWEESRQKRKTTSTQNIATHSRDWWYSAQYTHSLTHSFIHTCWIVLILQRVAYIPFVLAYVEGYF